MFEETDLFVRSSGETSEVVSKQMYTFTDKGGRSLTLKPEGTAPAMRAILEHGLITPGVPLRLWYNTPVFRYERPQKGRFRQHHQLGAELVGSAAPEADAEIVVLTVQFYRSLGIGSVRVLVNSLGRAETRSRYRAALLDYLGPWLADQSEETRQRVAQNPLRVLDSKDEDLRELIAGAPVVLDYLEDASRAHFERLQELLAEEGIDYRVEPRIVRGLDYYTDTVFEVLSTHLGAQSSLCGGGRYDGLIADLGGPSVPSVGVGLGLERALIVQEAEVGAAEPPGPDVFVAVTDVALAPRARELVRALREAGRSAVYDLDGRNLRGQLKLADRLAARHALILGPDELADGLVTWRDLTSGEQERISWDRAVEWFAAR